MTTEDYEDLCYEGDIIYFISGPDRYGMCEVKLGDTGPIMYTGIDNIEILE